MRQTVRCKIVDASLRNRLKTTEASFDERTALKLEKQGAVIICDVIATWTSPVPFDSHVDPNRPFIVWLEDQPAREGGAEFSSRQVVQVGRGLGYQIHYMTNKQFSVGGLVRADLIVLNNIAALREDQLRQLLNTLYEQGTPYVRYEHDAFFCPHRSPPCHGSMRAVVKECAGCRISQFHYYPRQQLVWKLFAGALLSVFISPLQESIHRRALGDVIDPYVLLRPPIDTEFFFPVPGIVRQRNLVVSMTGKIWYKNKGKKNLETYVQEHPDKQFRVYTKSHPHELKSLKALQNVVVLPSITYDQLPQIYSKAQEVIHVPSWPEAAGRTVVEGFLCGANPIMNDNCGVAHFDLPWNDPETFRKIIKEAPRQFWEDVRESMKWSIPKPEVACAFV